MPSHAESARTGFGHALRQARERSGLSLERVSRDLERLYGIEVSWTALSKIESAVRNVKIEEATALAHYLQFSLDSVLEQKKQFDQTLMNEIVSKQFKGMRINEAISDMQHQLAHLQADYNTLQYEVDNLRLLQAYLKDVKKEGVSESQVEKALHKALPHSPLLAAKIVSESLPYQEKNIINIVNEFVTSGKKITSLDPDNLKREFNIAMLYRTFSYLIVDGA